MNQKKPQNLFNWFRIHFVILPVYFLLSPILVLAQIERPDEIEQLSFSPNGQYIAVAGGSSGCDPAKKDTEYAVRIVDALTGQIVNRFVGHNCRLVAVDWSPDGTRIVSSSFDGLSLIWDVETGEPLQYSRIRPETGLGVVWSPDSTMIASIGSGGNYAMIWSAATGEILFSLPEHLDFTTSVVWSPDGSQIATSGLDNAVRVWDTASQEALLTILSSNQVYWVDWSADGAYLVSANRDGTIEIWDAVSGEAISSFSAGLSPINIVLWSPDGTRLVTANTDNAVQIWDAASGEQIAIFHYEGRWLNTVDWNPAGDYIAFAGTGNNGQASTIEIEFVGSEEGAPALLPTEQP